MIFSFCLIVTKGKKEIEWHLEIGGYVLALQNLSLLSSAPKLKNLDSEKGEQLDL
jgi:hypothetical protein